MGGKKKYRKIVVDKQSYGWTLNSYGKEHTVSVWQDKKVIFRGTVRTSEVTPSMVAELIKEYYEKKHLIFEEDENVV